MNTVLPIKQLFKIAIFTSTAIGIITMGPVFIIALTFGNIRITSEVLFKLLGSTTAGISLFVFLIWAINITLLKYSNKYLSFFKNKNIRYIASYLFCFFLLLSLRLFASPLINNPQRAQQILNWKIEQFGLNPVNFDILQFTNWRFQILIILFVVVSINSVVLIIQDLVLLIEKKARIESENVKLKIKNIEATNEKLKQQLQPHFLFNSLNVLKTLIRKHPDKAEAYLKRLSDFLRASVSFDQANTVKLNEELKLSIDYIEMQKIRFEEAIQFEMNIPTEMRDGTLPIFSIQLLLENAIKHNAFTPEAPLHIQLNYRDGWITVRNRIQKKSIEETYSGMGLLNLSERYKIISGDEIMITNDDTVFSVSIKILPNEYCNY